MLKKLRQECESEVFSYTFLTDHLQKYANPRGKINRLLKSGEIVRVKKGLYVFGQEYRNGPVNRAILANLIHGPSYVSGLYALAQHNLIPERVETVTSMTTQQRYQRYVTPFGEFEYFHLSQARYTEGIYWRKVNEKEYCLFATPEKALIDIVAKATDLTTKNDILDFIFENLRVDEDELCKLSLERISRIAIAYKSPIIRILTESIGGMLS